VSVSTLICWRAYRACQDPYPDLWAQRREGKVKWREGQRKLSRQYFLKVGAYDVTRMARMIIFVFTSVALRNHNNKVDIKYMLRYV